MTSFLFGWFDTRWIKHGLKVWYKSQTYYVRKHVINTISYRMVNSVCLPCLQDAYYKTLKKTEPTYLKNWKELMKSYLKIEKTSSEDKNRVKQFNDVWRHIYEALWDFKNKQARQAMARLEREQDIIYCCLFVWVGGWVYVMGGDGWGTQSLCRMKDWTLEITYTANYVIMKSCWLQTVSKIPWWKTWF